MRKYLHHILLTSCVLLVAVASFSQSTQTIFYTTKDGLPSNSIYRSILDNHGFLWIATDNGVSKFDGKNFKTYTTAQGLPDNEITDIFIDSSNRIWVTPFRRTAAYYNPLNDRFENEDTDPELKKIELGNANRGSVLQYGGIAFCNNNRDFFIYKEGKATVYKEILKRYKAATPEKIVEYKPGKYLVISSDSIRVFTNDRFVKSYALGKVAFYAEFFNNTLYISAGNKITKYKIEENGTPVFLSEKKFPFEVRIFCRSGKDFAVTTFNRTTYPMDTATLELKNPLLYNIAVRSVLEDRNGSIWISTNDRGLIKIQQKRISSFTITDKTLNDEITQHFNTIVLKDKKIITGNNYGEVLIYDGLYDIKIRSLLPGKNMDGSVRKIIELPDKFYVACQTGSFILNKNNYQIAKRFEGPENFSSKAALKLNDSVLILGSHSVVRKYNVRSGRVTDSATKRITALGANKSGVIYLGSNDGLYRWDKDSIFYFGAQIKALSYRVNCMFNSADDLVWVGLGSDSLLEIGRAHV